MHECSLATIAGESSTARNSQAFGGHQIAHKFERSLDKRSRELNLGMLMLIGSRGPPSASVGPSCDGSAYKLKGSFGKMSLYSHQAANWRESFDDNEVDLSLKL